MMNFENAHALLVGVGADLPVTVSDATAIAQVLGDKDKAAYKKENITLLTEENATKQNVLSALKTIINKVSNEEDSTVIIYYSGHGGVFNDRLDGDGIRGDYYLLTNGYDTNNREQTMILGTEFTELIDKIKAKKILIMLDCCHAAGMLGTKPLMKSVSEDKRIANSNVELLKMLRIGEGRVFVTSCDDDEQSVILPGSENSLFTEIVLEALSGKASKGEEYVRVIELLYHVLTQVPKRIKKYNHVQRPIINKIDFLSPDYYLCKSNIGNNDETFNPIKATSDDTNKLKLLLDKHNINNSHNQININDELNINNQENTQDLEESIKTVEKEIINGNTKKAITLFLKLTETNFTSERNKVILLAGQYNSLFKDKMVGLISDENYRIQMVKINNGLNYFLSQCD